AIPTVDALFRHRAGLSCWRVGDLLTIGDALACVLERVRPPPAEDVPLADAAGRVAAEPAAAAIDLPPFPSSAMDGYAVRSGDTPGTLRVIGQSAAGHPASLPVVAGTSIAISTGAVVPEGADAVVPVERTDGGAEAVAVEAVAPGDNVRPRGGDVHAGDVVVTAGSAIGPVQIGALAGSGVSTVRCGRRPRVAVLATGSELRRSGEPLGPGEIYESNGVMLAAQLQRAGAVPELLGAVADDRTATRAALERGLDADVLVTSGGVSVGEHDLVRDLLAELGVVEVFWRVAVKPGKPIAFGTRAATLVL